MKKALIITTVSGFLLKFEKENVKLLQQMGYEVHYAANSHNQMYQFDEGALEEAGVVFHHIDIKKSPFNFTVNLKALKQLKKLVIEQDISLIHCHTPVGGVLGRLCGALCKNVKVIYTCHGYHFYKGGSFVNNSVYYLIEKIMARFTDIIILINREDYENTLKFKLKKDGKVYQIPGIGLDLDKFKPVSETDKLELRRSLSLDEKKTFILSVGEINENKNHQIVLKALDILRSRGFDTGSLHYGICGDGAYRDSLSRMVLDYKLSDVVSLYGYCENVADYINAADFTVFPSEREGLGMAALESLACGVPVIAADNRGTREYMSEGKNGFVCNFDDADAFAESIEKLIRLRSEEKLKMSRYCMDSVRPFDKHITMQKMSEIYRQI